MPNEKQGGDVSHPAKGNPEPGQTTPFSATPEVPHAPPAQAISNQEVQAEIEDIEDRVKRAERWMIGLTAAIAFFGLCSVIVGCLQWQIFGGQLEEMKKAGEDTHILAVATQNSKAVFFGVGITPQPRLGRIAFDLRNDGRTVANISSITADLTIKKLSDDSIVQTEHREWSGPMLVPPSSGIGKWFEINGEWPDDPIRREETIWQELWQDIITVKVQIHYESGFGKTESQSFCWQSVADERVNGRGQRLAMPDHPCEEAIPFIQARKRQVQTPNKQ